MEFKEFITKFAALLDVANDTVLTPETYFRELDEWSPAVESDVVTLLESVSGNSYKTADIRNAETIGDLHALLNVKQSVENEKLSIEQIQEIVSKAIREYCELNHIEVGELSEYTPLIGSARILDSMGLVNVIVDIETAFLDEDIEVSLTSDAAMSARISPFRTIGALSHFIARQIGVEA